MVSLLMTGRLSVDPLRWSDQYPSLLKRAASYPEVARIFVSPAIKKQLCESVRGDRRWLSKLEPWWGHDDHFHVRLECPPGIASCVNQPPVGRGDGCGAELAWWFRPQLPLPKSSKPPPPPPTLAWLPRACVDVLYAQDAPVTNAGGDVVGKVAGKGGSGTKTAR